MALNEAMAVHPNDEETTLLLSDAYVLAGALNEAAALLAPPITSRKGKPSPGLAALYIRLAHIHGLAGDRPGQLVALGHALDADKKNGDLTAEVADRAEEAGDDELALKALRLIVAHAAPGPISVAEAFLRQARIAHRRGETERAIMFARRASHDAPKGDPVHTEARAFLEASEAAPSKPPPTSRSRK
jgi:tetratricopeptide (TPR) repeat protein